jgi:RNA exonuclease 1
VLISSVKEYLGYEIQQSGRVSGHSSVEDAKATLELLKWKIRRDKA